MKKEPKKPGRPQKSDDEKRCKKNYTMSLRAIRLLEQLSVLTGESMSAVLERCVREEAVKKLNPPNEADETKSSDSPAA
jgi:hypothetical protein